MFFFHGHNRWIVSGEHVCFYSFDDSTMVTPTLPALWFFQPGVFGAASGATSRKRDASFMQETGSTSQHNHGPAACPAIHATARAIDPSPLLEYYSTILLLCAMSQGVLRCSRHGIPVKSEP